MRKYEIDLKTYHEWINLYDSIGAIGERQIKEKIHEFILKPTISIVMPVYNPSESHLLSAIKAVQEQFYPFWELCIADDASTNPAVKEILNNAEKNDSRIRITFRSKNGHISAASNSALRLASGDFIALMDHDDLIPKQAIYLIVNEINHFPDANLIYSDSDYLDENGNRCNPYFKPAWNYDLFLSHNYITHLSVYRHNLIKKIGGFREGLEGSQDYDLALRIIENIPENTILHIPKILYHWRIVHSSFSRSMLKEATLKARVALKGHLVRKGYAATVTGAKGNPTFHRIRWQLPIPSPKVGIIVNIDRPLAEIFGWLERLLQITCYKDIQAIVLTDKEVPRETNNLIEVRSHRVPILGTKSLNEIAQQIECDVICFLERILVPKKADWLSEMVTHVVRKDVGLAGAKISANDGRLLHYGITFGSVGFGESDSDWHRSAAHFDGDRGYFSNFLVNRCVSSVSGGCLVIGKKLFAEIKGFDDQITTPILRDIDLSLKVAELGQNIIWCAYSELIATRVDSQNPVETRDAELIYLTGKWKSQLDHDPHYNCNLNRDYSLYSPPAKH